MRSISRKNLIIALMLSIVCLIAGLFFMEKKEPALTVYAEDVTTETIEGFDMIPGAALSTKAGTQELRISLTLTDDMVQKLSKATKREEYIFGLVEEYIPNNYYLKLIVTPKDGGASYSILYHIDPKNSRLPSEQLIIEENQARLMVPFSSDFEKEYKYYCEYGKSEKNTYQEPLYGGIYSKWEYTAIAAAPTSVTRSVRYIAQRALENEGEGFTTEQLNWFNLLAGYNNPGDTSAFPVIVSYKEVDTNGLITVKTFNFQAVSEYIGCPKIIYRDIMQRKGWESLDVFNVVLKNPDGTDERIVLVADGYTYEYDNNLGAGYLTITYRPFDYDKFCIRLQDNNPEDGVNLYYHIPVTQTSLDTATGIRTLTFDFAKIGNKCLIGNKSWLFKLQAKNFTVTKPEDSPITHVLTENDLKIKFKVGDEDHLQNIFVGVSAEIVEDKSYTVNMEYSALSFENGTIVDETVTESIEMLYSEWFALNSYTTFQESELYPVVTDALALPALEGQKYMTPKGIEGAYNDTDGTLTLRVLYQYNTLLQITDNIGNVHFVACDPSIIEYKIAKLGIAPVKGERIQKLTSTSPDVEIEFEESKANNLSVTVQGNLQEKKIIPLTVTYTNVWNLEIVYMETYKDTPFAGSKVYSTTVPIGKYDVENLTLSDVKTIMRRTDDMKICGVTRPLEKVEVDLTSESTYTATLVYGHGSLMQIDYNGKRNEIAVPLTRFSEWCKEFDEDLTIMALNKDPEKYPESKKYFEDEASIDRDNLYGFFSVAVFEEKVSDLNALFKSYTSGGSVVTFMEKETAGSKIYKFFDKLKNSFYIPTALGARLWMAFCEVANDENKTLNSAFFYMDATEGYISNGGADDAYDTDGASKNWWDDLVVKLKPGLEKTGEGILVVLGVAGVIGAIVGIVWLKQKLNPATASAATATSGGSNATKKSKPKKKKKAGKKKSGKKPKQKASKKRRKK